MSEVHLTATFGVRAWHAWKVSGTGSPMRLRTPVHVYVDAPGKYVLKIEGIPIDVEYLNFLEAAGTGWCEVFATFFGLGGWFPPSICISLQGHQRARVKVVSPPDGGGLYEAHAC